jgi:hypothetical protein
MSSRPLKNTETTSSLGIGLADYRIDPIRMSDLCRYSRFGAACAFGKPYEAGSLKKVDGRARTVRASTVILQRAVDPAVTEPLIVGVSADSHVSPPLVGAAVERTGSRFMAVPTPFLRTSGGYAVTSCLEWVVWTLRAAVFTRWTRAVPLCHFWRAGASLCRWY